LFNLGGDSGEAGFTFLHAFIILPRLDGELGDRDALLLLILLILLSDNIEIPDGCQGIR
jgi:hypothetical protein